MSLLIHELRPQFLEEIVGNNNNIDLLKKRFLDKKVPNFFLIIGESGTGKTTIARIISRMLQNTTDISLKKYDITEINAADKNGIDDIRSLIEKLNYKPLAPSLSKVIILDEAHQLTQPAQNALLKITEDTPSSSYIIFCTTNGAKIIPALKRRAFVINTTLLKDEEIKIMLEKASKHLSSSVEINDLYNCLLEHDIRSPGLILQAAEKYFMGIPPEKAISNSSSELELIEIPRSISKGSWKSTAALLSGLKKDDVMAAKNITTSYLKTILLKSEGEKALKLAKAIKELSSSYDDLPAFVAAAFIACSHISSK